MRDRRDKPGDEYWPDDRAAGEYAPEGRYATYGQGGPGRPRGDLPGGPAGGGPAGGGPAGGGPAGRGVPDGDRGRRPGPQPRPPERPYRGPGPGGSREPAADEWPGTQPVPLPGSGAAVTEPGLPGPVPGAAGLAGSPAAASARPYGRILIFTLLDDRVTDFDRLAEEAAEHVRTGEPDTLVYVIHLVPNAPLQRIFYEIYRDRAAFDSHEGQPYMQRFAAERRTCVIATNVIELRLKYAKVAPVPGPQPPAPAAPLPAAPPRGVPGPPVPQRARPLPPPRPQRSDQPRSDQQRYDRPRYEQPGYAEPGYDQSGYDQSRGGRERYDERRPDQRQIPSGRPYGG